MIAVYLSSQHYIGEGHYPNAGWHGTPQFANFLRFHEVEIFWDWDRFCAASAHTRVIFDDFDRLKINSEQSLDQMRDHVERMSQAADWVFIVETEMYYHDYVLLADPGYQPPANVRWLMPGTIAGRESYIIPWHYHLWRLADLYRDRYRRYFMCHRFHGILAADLESLDQLHEKTYVFDALLGTPRHERVWLRDCLDRTDFRSSVMLRMLPGMRLHHLPDPQDFHCEPSWDLAALGAGAEGPTVAIIEHRGYPVQISNIIAVAAYQQCWFSLASETGHVNHTHMVTEKTAKLLLAKRVFLMQTGRGFMRYLREQGFRTFADVIDESYDDISDDHERWGAIVHEMANICGRDPRDTWQRCQPMTQHNQHIMLTRDFVRPVLDQIEALIEPTLRK